MLRGETKVELTDLCFLGMAAELRHVEKWRQWLPHSFEFNFASHPPSQRTGLSRKHITI